MTHRKRDTTAMTAAIRSLIYISSDSQVAIHAAARGFTVTAAEVAKVRRSQPGKRGRMRAEHYLPDHMTKGDVGYGEYQRFRTSAAEGSAKLLAAIMFCHPERLVG